MKAAPRSTVPLGAVLSRSVEPVDVVDGERYGLAGVYSFGRGVLLREPVSGDDIAAKQLFRIRSGQIIYSKLTAFEGAFACVGPDADGRVVSNEFPVFAVDRTMAVPEYLELILCRPATWDELVYTIPGGGSRRERFQIDDFLEFPVDLPPIGDQRAIVRAVKNVIRARDAASAEADALAILRQSLREDLFAGLESAPLEELATEFEGGDSPKCEDRAPLDDEWGVLKVGAIRPGLFRADEAKALPAATTPNRRAEVRQGDIIMNRASGTRALVASFCRVGRVRPRLLLSDLHWRVHLAHGVHPDLLVEAMALVDVRDQIDERISGTTGAGKVSRERIWTIDVPFTTDPERQSEIAGRLFTLRDSELLARDRVAALTRLAEGLASELVSGSRAAPTRFSPPNDDAVEVAAGATLSA
jgi:hypothetical protein